MRFSCGIGNKTIEVEAEGPGSDGGYGVTLGERKLDLTFQPVSANELQVALDGKPHRLQICRTREGTWVWWEGRARLVRDADQPARRRFSGPGAPTPDSVTPPTPAVVVRILAAVGDRVSQGDPLVVVSAMKMETTLTAPYDGEITAINTEEGANVSPGESLVDVERAHGEEDE